MPLSFMPPKGAISVEMIALVDADDAVFGRLGDPPDPVLLTLTICCNLKKTRQNRDTN
jgi:hypothetical protein